MTSVARRRAFLGAALAAGLLASVVGCGRSAEGEEVTTLAPPPAAAGHPPGTVTLPVGSDVPAEVKKLQDAITAGGGTVVATVDNTADADLLGVTIPPNTVVVGGPPAAGLPMLRDNQQAAAALPGRYLVTQDAVGAVKLVYNGPEYVAVVAGAVDPALSTPFAQSVTQVADAATGATGSQKTAPLVGVSPTGFLRVADSNTTVPTAVTRVTVAATNRETVVSTQDLATGSGASGPALRVAESNTTVPIAVTRVTVAATNRETVISTQDLATGSGASGPALRATQSVLLSAPEFTTPLVAAAPTFGLELPLRFVIWLNDKNVTQVGYVDVGVLAARHGLKADDPNVVKLAAECDRIAKIVAG